MCHSIPVFLRARFNPLQFLNALQGRNHTITQPDASMHPSNAYAHYEQTLTPPYFQYKSTTRKRKTLPRLTETEHISFAPVMPITLELQPT